MESITQSPPSDFIRDIIDADITSGRRPETIATRFPPEPNGYPHIGHAKSICLNFGIASQYGGTCNLRLDDTDPSGEGMEYVESIIRDVKWLGFDWGESLYFASNYYEQIYRYAVALIKKGLAYVCDLSAEEMREYRGTLTQPGKESPFRGRSIDENIDLFERMRAGEFADGARVLRAKIDMASPNVALRDPVIYRIKKTSHYRTGDAWCIYPMYDFAHCLSDYIEGISHSICTLEFENNRPLYEWFLDKLVEKPHPRQIEFARLNLNFTVMSKRKLMELVDRKLVTGWDDPRMPTLSGMRRRGYTPESIRNFCEIIGVSKNDSLIDMSLLENCVREDLNDRAPRVMAVLRPLRVIIDNYPEGKEEELDCPYHPKNPGMGSRKAPFTRELFIEKDDFMEVPAKKFFRLFPGKEVRLRCGYLIRCVGIVKDSETGEVTEIHCTYDPQTRSGFAPDGRKVDATIHWVSAAHATVVEARLYDRLFSVPEPLAQEGAFIDYINPGSVEALTSCRLEKGISFDRMNGPLQFERLGYFIADCRDSSADAPVFNRTVTLRDAWAKISGKGK